MNLQLALQKRLKRFRKRLQRLQKDATAENIHDFRIACREVLACYPLLKTIGPAKRWKPFLKDTLDALDRLRDLQQMQEHLLLQQQQLLQDSPVHRALEKQIRKATRRWLNYAPSLQAPELLLAVVATEKSLKRGNSLSNSLQDAFEKHWKKSLLHTRKCLLAAEASDLDSLHRLRIRYKRLRYLLALLENDIPLSLYQERLKQWQDMLGEVQNFRVMARLAGELELPATLHQEFLSRADELSRDCIAQRAALALFLVRIDDQVKALL